MREHPDWPNLFAAYGFKPDMIQKVSSSVWKITCADSMFAIKATNVPENRMQMISDLLDKAVKQGVESILPFHKTQFQRNFVATNNCRWYVTPWKQSKSRLQPLEVARSLGKFHRVCQSLVSDYTDWRNQFSYQDIMDWKRKEIRLANFCDALESRQSRSPFDKEFLEGKYEVEKSLLFAIRAAEKFVENDEGVPPRYTLCHTRLHVSNILRDSDQFYFIDFDNAQIDTPIRDLATLLRRASLNHSEYKLEPLNEIIRAYESENKLQAKEKRLLAFTLSYPERLLNLFEKYYSGDAQIRNLDDESKLLVKLEHEMAHFLTLKELVVKLWATSGKPKASATKSSKRK